MVSRRLTIYLLRKEVDDFQSALDPEKSPVSVAMSSESGIDGRFFYSRPAPSKPKWVSFVEVILDEQLPEINSASASGLLLLKSSDRLFALTFGYGRSYLDLSKIEYQFGLRVALNRIDPRQLRSLDTKTFEDLVVSTNTQVSKSAELPSFRIDVSTDILRAATGEPRDESLAKRIAGSDSLTINLEISAFELPDLCDKLLEAFRSEEYKSDFGWIDQLTQVRDLDVIDELNQLLVGQLASGSASATHLAMPEGINWQDIDGFKIAGTGRRLFDELDLDDYLECLGDSIRQLSLTALKQRRVSVVFTRSGEADARWNLFHCLVSEQRLRGILYVLIEGRWFAVSQTLVEEVDRFLSRIPDYTLQLIAAECGEVEGSYNSRLVESNPELFLKFDGRIARAAGASSSIEFCDVLTINGDIIHVKRKSRSSTLSHLFAQGSVAATTFLADGFFRERLRDYINQYVPSEARSGWLALIPDATEEVERSRYSVIFAVVANTSKNGRDWLPFFSKLNLMQQGRQIINTGYRVMLARIPIVEIEKGI